jgi:hypothetical protein
VAWQVFEQAQMLVVCRMGVHEGTWLHCARGVSGSACNEPNQLQGGTAQLLNTQEYYNLRLLMC